VHDLRGNRTVIIIAHRLATIRECDMILVFNDGLLVGQGSYYDLLAKCDTFRELAQQAPDLAEHRVPR
jgi:HlyD family secretion protein